uniref:NAD-dependent epimerase/dehydratase family protein n=1 Tax=Thermodesulfobacterium geofontis TaxID=1295609 RepID=A0A7C4JRJ7_9BACT
MKNKRILITGVCGFIGKNLARRLMNKNKIIGVDNFEYSKRDEAKDLIREIEFIEADVSNREIFNKLPKDIDYIFHFGAPSSVILFNRNPMHCYTETVVGMWNILEFAKSINIRKLIYPSSGSVYAGNKMPHTENILPRPRNLYAAAKVACEGLAFSYIDFVDSVGLRIFAGYGPGEESKGEYASVVYLFIKDILNNRSPKIFGDGNQSRDFIYIDDVINAILKSAEIDYTGIINVGSGVSTSFNRLVEIINSLVGKNIKPVYIPREKNYVEVLRADIKLMSRLLKIKVTPLVEGVKKFVDYLVKEDLL